LIDLSMDIIHQDEIRCNSLNLMGAIDY